MHKTVRLSAVALLAAATLGAATGLAGCAGGSASGPSSLGNVPSGAGATVDSPGIGAAPSASGPVVGTSSTTAKAGGGTGGGTGSAPTYPGDAKGYAAATLNAYDTKDLSRLAGLASTLKGAPADIANIHTSDKHWHFHRCSPDGVYTACAWDNNNGDEISFDIDPTLLGKPHATEGSSIEPTQYGNTADAMVGEFMQAWFDGNKYRMISLADSSTVTWVLSTGAAPVSWTMSDLADVPGHTIVNVNATGGPFSFNADNAKLGHPHALTRTID